MLKNVKDQFPAFQKKINGHTLVYLDSAATTLKPKAVIERIHQFNSFEASNVHRGAHYLSDQATQNFETARLNIKTFLNAKVSSEIIFTSGTTEGINLIATAYGETFLKAGDEIVVTELEHHANLVPWQNLASKMNLKLKHIPVLSNGDLDYDSINTVITERTRLVSFTGCSNLLGTIPNIDIIIKKARSVGAVTVLDAAQLVTQKSIDVQKLDVDFLVFSAHKIFGPFGFGVLYGKNELLKSMPPYKFGGSMISEVYFDQSTYNDLPFKFETGTPHIEGALGTDTALQFFNQFAIQDVFSHEQRVLSYAKNKMKNIDDIILYPHGENHAAILSFNMKGAHHADVGQILDQQGVAVRVGHHCVQPLLRKMNLTGTIRASFSIYNDESDVDTLVDALIKARKMLL